ncbi:unnamed protein product [Meganyctiphanes norvegica]|uniref:Uncharacterized protein n=1 Tax=Meganyctiphanes norvegica TaxID=48144 RepID=A0AAV2RI46_MEGNR
MVDCPKEDSGFERFVADDVEDQEEGGQDPPYVTVIKYWHMILAIAVCSVFVCVGVFGFYIYDRPKRKARELLIAQELEMEELHQEIFKGALVGVDEWHLRK